MLTALLLLTFSVDPARAQTPGSVFGDIAETLHLRPTPPPAAPFVDATRPDPDALQYRPLTPADRDNHRKSPAELDALANKLEGARQNALRAAARVWTPDQPAGARPAQPSGSKTR
jgi:hypothetical protein